MQYLIRDDEPFRGHCQSVLNPDGTVAYTNGLTVVEYERERGYKVRVVSEAEFSELIVAHEQSLKTKPRPITEERFWEMLEVLPPCRWHNAGGYEVFHVSERLTGELVNWFAHKDDRYWEFVDDSTVADKELVALLTD